MPILSRRSRLAIAAVVDIALHARPTPVNARALAGRHGWPARHLETALQALVRCGILRSVRGPRGGYELARERRRITAGDIVRAALAGAEGNPPAPESRLVGEVVEPLTRQATDAFLVVLDGVTVEDLCRQAEQGRVFGRSLPSGDFTI